MPVRAADTSGPVDRGRLRFWYEGRLAIDLALASTPPRGLVGVFSGQNAIRVARAALSLSPPKARE